MVCLRVGWIHHPQVGVLVVASKHRYWDVLGTNSAIGNHEAIDADFRQSEFSTCETGIFRNALELRKSVLRMAKYSLPHNLVYLPRLLELLPRTFRAFARSSLHLELVVSILTC